MANLLYNVKRIFGLNKNDLASKLKEKMIGGEVATKKLGAKFPDGSVEYYTPDGSDASFNSIWSSGANFGTLSIGGLSVATEDFVGNAVKTSKGTRNLNMSDGNGLFSESNASQDSSGVLGFNAPVHIGGGEWATTSIGRSLGRMGMFSSDSNPIHILANMSNVSADNGAYLKLGARATNGIANMTSVNYGGFKENSVGGDFRSYALVQLSDQLGGTVDGFKVNSLGVATLPSSSLTKIKDGGDKAVVTNEVLDDRIPQWQDWTSGSITLPNETGTWELVGSTDTYNNSQLTFPDIVASGSKNRLAYTYVTVADSGSTTLSSGRDIAIAGKGTTLYSMRVVHKKDSKFWQIEGVVTHNQVLQGASQSFSYMCAIELTSTTLRMAMSEIYESGLKYRKIA